jgi:hypothetical protein
VLALGTCLVATALAARQAPAPASRPDAPGAEKHQGVSWVAGREIGPADLDRLAAAGVEWIAQTPFGWQAGPSDPHVELVTGGRVYWGETDEGIAATTALARERGIETLLKPHVWVRGGGGAWPGDVAFQGEEQWQRWFASYRTFLLHYARLAQRLDIPALCVGTELRRTVSREAQWRTLIAAVRQVYDGRLVYAANWHGELEEVPFWDALDYVGVQAYFPLSEAAVPAVEELVAAWDPHLGAVERVQARWSKPVLFTEIGYRSVAGALARPWEWPRRGDRSAPTVEGLAAQANGYEAFFRAVWHRPWFAGAYVWKWFPDGARDGGGGFSPQGKPAEAVLARWYGGREAR